MTQNQKRSAMIAERLKGSPPPELPDYACDSAPTSRGCKYTFRTQKVIASNLQAVTYLLQNTGFPRMCVLAFTDMAYFGQLLPHPV